MKKSDVIYLKHILDSINRIEQYTENVDYDSFMINTMVQDAVIRQLEIIGEATKRLSKDFRETHPLIPWKDIAGMRDKLIHDYLGVDIDAVWETIKKDIPALKNKIKKILQE
ncbi:MAG: DUF86 domain-containing protein [Candidatus Asgardarchaeia archaeon]